MKILKDIKSSYSEARLIPFIGAGFSKNIQGYPDWDGFIRKLSKKLAPKQPNYIKKIMGDNRLQSVEYFMMRKIISEGRQAETDWYSFGKALVKNELDLLFSKKKFNGKTWQAQIALVNLKKISLFYTTNWDDTLEKTCDEILGNDQFISYYTVSQLEKLKEQYYENLELSEDSRKKLIIKLHGDYKDSASIISSEYDYYHRMNTFDALDTVFQSDLLQNDFLFLGFSFSDVNINYLLYQINSMRRLISPNKKVYLLSILEPDPSFYELYEKRKNVIVYFLFESSEEYINYSGKSKKEKTEILKDKTVKFLNQISDGELKTVDQLKEILDG